MRLGTVYREMVIQALQIPLNGKHVLDIGCHDGFLLSKITAESRTGIDLQPIEKYQGINYITADFLDYDFMGEKFDLIFALDVIEHIKDDELFFQKILALLAPGGHAFLTTPSSTISVFPAFLQSWVDRRWDHTFRRGYSKKDIRQIFVKDPKNPKTFVLSFKMWNASYFRLFYIPLSLIWRISQPLSYRLLKRMVGRELLVNDCNDGFLLINVNHISENTRTD